MMHGIVTLEMSGELPRAEPDAVAAAVQLFVAVVRRSSRSAVLVTSCHRRVR